MCTVDFESLKQCLDRHTITWVPGRQVGGVMEPRTLEPSTVSDGLQKQIARLAFQLYESRGREDGHDVEDWMQAEAVLRREAILPRASVAAAVYED